MSRVLPLAWLYLLGTLRRQAHLATLFLGALLFLLPSYVNSFSLGADAFERVAKDFGLILIGYFAIGMAILLGSTSVPQDRESRSIYPILARPLSRSLYLLAHLLAIVAMLAASVAFLGLCLGAAMGLMLRQVDLGLPLALYGSLLQAILIASLTLMLSLRLSTAAAGTVGTAIFLGGHLSLDVFRLVCGDSRLAAGLKAALPDLSALTLKDSVVHGVAISPSYLWGMAFYTLGWVAVAMLLAREAFQEVDL